MIERNERKFKSVPIGPIGAHVVSTCTVTFISSCMHILKIFPNFCRGIPFLILVSCGAF